jgi:adenylate cyclase class 2
MNSAGREKEVKFYLADPARLTVRLGLAGFTLTRLRAYEHNIRYDTPDHTLSTTGRVLRLRADGQVRLTYKGGQLAGADVADREEFEVAVSDLETTRLLLQGLGYVELTRYEKYRSTWQGSQCEVTIDEMPYGTFCEVEGPDASTIQQAAETLGLNWQRRVLLSYLAIFELLKEKAGIQADSLLFADFSGKPVTAAQMALIEITPADQ